MASSPMTIASRSLCCVCERNEMYRARSSEVALRTFVQSSSHHLVIGRKVLMRSQSRENLPKVSWRQSRGRLWFASLNQRQAADMSSYACIEEDQPPELPLTPLYEGFLEAEFASGFGEGGGVMSEFARGFVEGGGGMSEFA